MFYKAIDNGYITAIGTNGGGTEITEAEYNSLLELIQSKPARTESVDYKLTVNLEWEAFEIPAPPEDYDLTDEEALAIIMGVSE